MKANLRSRTAGLLGALLGGFLRCLFLRGFFDSLLRGFLDSLLRGFFYGFLRGLLGGFLGCFFRHNYSPGNRGLKTKHKQRRFVP